MFDECMMLCLQLVLDMIRLGTSLFVVKYLQYCEIKEVCVKSTIFGWKQMLCCILRS